MNFFGEKVRIDAIDSLIVSMDHVLSPAGFKQIAKGEWQRTFTWKVEEVDLRVGQISREGLQPSFRVALPRSDMSPLGDTYEYLAEEKLPRIIEPSVRASAHIPIPSLGFNVTRFVCQITSSVERGLHWFDQFATPDLCKANLPKFVKSGCPHYLAVEKFLASLSETSF